MRVWLPDRPGALGEVAAGIRSVPGVDIEDLRVLDGVAHDPRADALEAAAVIVGARDRTTLLDSVVTHGRRVLGGEWAAVLRMADGELLAGDGEVPLARWLVAFVEGSRTSARVSSGATGPDDVVWAPLPGTGMALVVGRAGAPFRARERRQVSALARIVDTRLIDLSRRLHPSAQG